MNKQDRERPRAIVVVINALLTLAAIIAMTALPQMRAGESTWEAVRGVVFERGFWTSRALPLIIIWMLMVLVFPQICHHVLRNRVTGKPSWTRNRWLVTLGGLVFILGTAIPIAANTLRGVRTYSLDQLAFTVVLWLLYGWLIVRLWLFQPTPEWKHGFETGDHSRSMDERYQLALGKSAVTTLYWTLALLFVGGSLFDILVTHTWPVRSMLEFTIILLLWNTILQKVNRKL